MSTIKRIAISGFRGVLAEFRLDLTDGNGCQSLILYGRNGTGKSSITDAWEWFRTQRIDHLAREGAKEAAYPHRAARKGECYVEVEFADKELGTIRGEFDLERVTKPKFKGAHSAVFLASVRRFNPNFRFVILDDVVNSLDGYKRPQLLRILRTSFAEYQILLLTHDSVWRDRVYRELPKWRRVNFVRHDYGIGPIVRDGFATLDEVRQALDDDRPRQAGQALGPYLEEELQQIAESFEVELKFNRRNEYTLEPLLDGVRLRTERKLGKDHVLVKLFSQLRLESGFRNLTAHAKNPEIELTPQELRKVVEIWEQIEKLVRCQGDSCGQTLRYEDPKFVCACGKSLLEKPPKMDRKATVASTNDAMSGQDGQAQEPTT